MLGGDIDGDDGVGDYGSHAGPWPAFVDLFASAALLLLVFFVVITARYVRDLEEVVQVNMLEDALAAASDSGQRFQVSKEGTDVLIELEESVTFPERAFTVASMRKQGRDALKEIQKIIARDAGLVRQVDIVGHADRNGSDVDNWMLSVKRAVSVAQFLVDSAGADPCSTLPSGRGEFFPRRLSGESNVAVPDRRRFALDRRIEIFLRPRQAAEGSSAGRPACIGTKRRADPGGGGG